MPSSTSRRGSFEPGLLALLFVGIAGAPLLWLMTLQSGYVLAYQACDDRTRSWVVVPTVGGVVLGIAIGLLSVNAYRRARHEQRPLPFLAWVAIGMSLLSVVALAASTIAPLLLHPCD